MNFFRLATIAFAAAAAVPAAAQGQIQVGTAVVDPAGNPVGTVTAIQGGNLIVKTDRHEVSLPSTSFTPDKGKLLFAMSQAHLNAETDKALAAANAALVAGAEVRGTGGAVVGTIDAIDAESVTIKLTSGELLRLPRSAIAGSPQGGVLGVSAEELQQLAKDAAAQ